MTMKPLTMSILAMLCSLSGCTAQTTEYRSVEAAEFARLISDTAQATVTLDVRTAAEYADGHIARARNIDVLNDGFENAATGKLPKDKTIAVYCRSGKRSKKAAAILSRNGYRVVELNSGYNGWTAAGMPTER